jgi:hypothetical protein
MTVRTGAGIAARTGLLDRTRDTNVQGRIFGDEAEASRGPVRAFGPVDRGGEHLNELMRVCGHGSDEDVAREVSVWMEYERHEDGDVDPFPPEELAWIFYWWYTNYAA